MRLESMHHEGEMWFDDGSMQSQFGELAALCHGLQFRQRDPLLFAVEQGRFVIPNGRIMHTNM